MAPGTFLCLSRKASHLGLKFFLFPLRFGWVLHQTSQQELLEPVNSIGLPVPPPPFPSTHLYGRSRSPTGLLHPSRDLHFDSPTFLGKHFMELGRPIPAESAKCKCVPVPTVRVVQTHLQNGMESFLSVRVLRPEDLRPVAIPRDLVRTGRQEFKLCMAPIGGSGSSCCDVPGDPDPSPHIFPDPPIRRRRHARSPGSPYVG